MQETTTKVLFRFRGRARLAVILNLALIFAACVYGRKIEQALSGYWPTLLGLVGLLVLGVLLRIKFSNALLLRFCGVVLGLLVFVSLVFSPQPIEYVHLVKYGALGFFLFFGFPPKVGEIYPRLFITTGAAFFFGAFEETLQLYVPERVFDFWDIGLNAIGGIFGSLLALALVRLLDRNSVERGDNSP